MRVSCTTCLELLTASDELSSVPCGHVFHTQCILQWFETGKSNCPQCRTRAKESQGKSLIGPHVNVISVITWHNFSTVPDRGVLSEIIKSAYHN